MLASGASKKVVEKLGMKVTNDALAKLAGYATLSFSTAVVSGANSAAFSVIDGKSSDEVLDSFLIGAAVGAGCSAAVSALSEVITKFGPEISKIVQKTMPNKWLSKINEKAEKISTFIGEHQVHLKNQDLENLLAPKSVYQATKSARNALNSEKNIFEDKIKNLIADDNKNFVKVDAKGNKITKVQLKENGGNCKVKLADNCDEELKAAFEKWNVKELTVKDGVIDQSPISAYKFQPEGGITSNRENNMNNFHKQLAEKWDKDPASIPEQIKKVLPENKKIDASTVKNALSDAGLTLHEEVDGFVYLVDSKIHSKMSHYGGVALAKAQAMSETASTYLELLLTSSTYNVSGTLMP